MLFFSLFIVFILSQRISSKVCFEDSPLKTTDLDLIHKIDEMIKKNNEFKTE
jgi:hypothetical protein